MTTPRREGGLVVPHGRADAGSEWAVLAQRELMDVGVAVAEQLRTTGEISLRTNLINRLSSNVRGK